MKKIKFALLSLLLLLPMGLQAQKGYTIDQIPNVQLTDERRFVSNPDGVLSQGAVRQIDDMLYRLKQEGKAQVAVIAVNSIGYEEPFDFLLKLMEKWGVGGRGTDSGLGVLLVIDQGAIEILTGYGLEGDLPDAMLNRVINNYMLPSFRKGDWDKGMIDGIAVISEILDGRIPEDVASDAGEGTAAIIIFFIIFILFPILTVLLVLLFSNRCPKCKKRKLKRTGSEVMYEGQRKVEEVTYVCQNCGKVVKKKHNIHDNNSSGGSSRGGGGTIIIGGMPRGGFGGGGSSRGGSWGGGSFGGGGSRGRF